MFFLSKSKDSKVIFREHYWNPFEKGKNDFHKYQPSALQDHLKTFFSPSNFPTWSVRICPPLPGASFTSLLESKQGTHTCLQSLTQTVRILNDLLFLMTQYCRQKNRSCCCCLWTVTGHQRSTSSYPYYPFLLWVSPVWWQWCVQQRLKKDRCQLLMCVCVCVRERQREQTWVT